ncbi:hypothetical protein [Sulfuricurvum sp.]|uniref:hypothetical protein n=1 Tax=Sulfuricurvum sp. TaxID=2025608 RepID=UPI00261E4B4D|nr:hypothetical protein [Sulfuricurvum sp.]MDD3598330.1 hypothetical protein [Sulfuricurvum sp.]
MKRGMIAMSVVAVMAMSGYGAEYERIGDRWKASPEYQTFLNAGGDATPQGKEIKEKAITELINDAMQQFVGGFDKKYQDRMAKTGVNLQRDFSSHAL